MKWKEVLVPLLRSNGEACRGSNCTASTIVAAEGPGVAWRWAAEAYGAFTWDGYQGGTAALSNTCRHMLRRLLLFSAPHDEICCNTRKMAVAAQSGGALQAQQKEENTHSTDANSGTLEQTETAAVPDNAGYITQNRLMAGPRTHLPRLPILTSLRGCFYPNGVFWLTAE